MPTMPTSNNVNGQAAGSAVGRTDSSAPHRVVGRPQRGNATPRQSTTLLEFDTSNSTAIERIAVNKVANELIVQFRGNSKTYVYRNCPFNLIDAILEEPSLGKFTNNVKALSSAVTMSKFPPNTVMFDPVIYARNKSTRQGENGSSTSKKKKQIADRSAEWTAVLKSVDLLSLDILDDLIAQLHGMHQVYPPRKAPRVSPSLIASSPLLKPTEVMVSNIFENFRHLEDSSDDGSVDANGTAATATARATTANESVQSRYFLMKFFCAKSEKQRKQAVDAQKRKKYVETKDFWVDAFDTINYVVNKTNWWHNEMLYQGRQQKKMVHNPSHAREILDAVSVLAHDTEREKAQAIRFLYRRLEALEKEVYSITATRNHIRKVIGEERWRSNPSPKLTHSEKRRLIQQEIHDIDVAINVIEPLCITNA
jgi:hypothetical protein